MALFAQANTDFIEKTCESEHIPEEKQGDIAGIAGYVLMGFLHPEDLAAEYRDELNIDIYELGGMTPPEKMPETGWSRTPPNPHSERGGTSTTGSSTLNVMPSLTKSAVPKAYVPSSTPTLQKTESGKISIPMPPGGSTPPILPLERGGTGTTSGPAPMMLGNEDAAKPIAKVPDFKMVSDERIASVSKFASPVGVSVKPATLEWSGMKPPLPPKPAGTPRVADYSSAPQEQGRRVVEVTGGAQTPNPKPQSPTSAAVSSIPVPPGKEGQS
jgi:hypothetical protein